MAELDVDRSGMSPRTVTAFSACKTLEPADLDLEDREEMPSRRRLELDLKIAFLGLGSDFLWLVDGVFRFNPDPSPNRAMALLDLLLLGAAP